MKHSYATQADFELCKNSKRKEQEVTVDHSMSNFFKLNEQNMIKQSMKILK